MRASNFSRVSAALGAAKAHRSGPAAAHSVEECLQCVRRALIAEDAQERRGVGADDVAVTVVEAGVGRWVDHPVEHHRPDAVGEEIGVGRPEIGAVRRAKVGQLLVADRLAQLIHVARHVRRREMGEGLGVALLAPSGKLLSSAFPRRFFLGTNGHGRHLAKVQERHLLGDAVEAAYGRALADTARVEPDDIKPLLERLGQRGVLQWQRHEPGATWAAGVEDERPDPIRLISGGNPRHGQSNRRANGLVVVQGNLELRALPGGQRVGRAGRPGDRGFGDSGHRRGRHRGGRDRGGDHGAAGPGRCRRSPGGSDAWMFSLRERNGAASSPA